MAEEENDKYYFVAGLEQKNTNFLYNLKLIIKRIMKTERKHIF